MSPHTPSFTLALGPPDAALRSWKRERFKSDTRRQTMADHVKNAAWRLVFPVIGVWFSSLNCHLRLVNFCITWLFKTTRNWVTVTYLVKRPHCVFGAFRNHSTPKRARLVGFTPSDHGPLLYIERLFTLFCQHQVQAVAPCDLLLLQPVMLPGREQLEI